MRVWGVFVVIMPALKHAQYEKFCKMYVYGNSAGTAYKLAFGRGDDSSDKSGRASGWRLLQRPDIIARIAELREKAAIKNEYDVARFFADQITIATADRREIMEIRHDACRYCYGVDHLYQWKEREYLEALAKAEEKGEKLPDIAGGFGYLMREAPNPECPSCEGLGVEHVRFADTRTYSPAAAMIYDGVKVTDKGMEVKLRSAEPAYANIAKMLGIADKKIISGPNDGPIELDVSGLSAEALEELARLAPND